MLWDGRLFWLQLWSCHLAPGSLACNAQQRSIYDILLGLILVPMIPGG